MPKLQGFGNASWRLLTACALTLLIGCSNNSPPSPTESPAPGTVVPLGATLHASVQFQGAIRLNGAYDVAFRSSDPARNSCRGLANPKEAPASFVVPFPSTLGNYHVTVSAAASPYKGAGNYGSNRFRTLQMKFEDKANRRTDLFRRGSKGAVKLTVRPDGSGTFTFAGLVDDTNRSLSGKVRWTCS